MTPVCGRQSAEKIVSVIRNGTCEEDGASVITIILSEVTVGDQVLAERVSSSWSEESHVNIIESKELKLDPFDDASEISPHAQAHIII